MDLWKTIEILKSDKYEWVDLSYPVSEKTHHYWLFDDLETTDLMTFEKDNVSVREYKMVSQYGTHIDPPGHFVQGARVLHEIGLKECAFPLCVIDMSVKAAQNPDYAMTVADLLEWEEKHGKIPENSFVAMRTDWSKKEGAAFFNKDANGDPHYPGWSIDALKFLCEERSVGAIGHEPPDTDPAEGNKTALWAAEIYLLKQDKYQVEMLKNLDKLPAAGAIIFISFPNVLNAPGFTARCFAICEK